jgi:hypothetical protein
MAENARRREQAALDLLDVGAAYAAGVDPDEHLAPRRLGHRNLLDLQDARPPVHGGAHGHEGRSYPKSLTSQLVDTLGAGS